MIGARLIDSEPKRSLGFVMAGLARLAQKCATLDETVSQALDRSRLRIDARRLLPQFAAYLEGPADEDLALAAAARRFGLEPIETLAVRLAIAAEQDLLIGNLLSHLQQPLQINRPSIALAAQAFAPEDAQSAVYVLGQGRAVWCGMLRLSEDDGPLPERQLRVPLPIACALQGRASRWPGAVPILFEQHPVPLGASAEARAAQLAARVSDARAPGPLILIRCADATEARAAAAAVCEHAGQRALAVQGEELAGLAPWLALNDLLPVFSLWLSPGERRAAPRIPGHAGAVIVLTGPEGDIEDEERAALEWRVATPGAEERRALWHAALADPELATQLGCDHRHGAGRIAQLAARARELASEGGDRGAVHVTRAQVRAVARRGDGTGLGALAELIGDEVGDEALITTPELHEELESLVVRCRLREQFAERLGVSVRTRYRPSVRVLFTGPSGTGKTLAVAWLATRLGMPLYRVDLAAVTSKYIGETERNLSQLLARAEQSEVILLFDEADALFGKRTDISDSNDRFANAQTNYLLQRMETYDGITVLTSNGRGRFDEAFSRRFDAIIAFPLPGPQQRRDLWLSHLGAQHVVSAAQLNLLAAAAELTGGQVRNAVLRAAVAAEEEGTGIGYRHVLAGVAGEYRKLSRQLPNELKQAQVAAACS